MCAFENRRNGLERSNFTLKDRINGLAFRELYKQPCTNENHKDGLINRRNLNFYVQKHCEFDFEKIAKKKVRKRRLNSKMAKEEQEARSRGPCAHRHTPPRQH